MDQFPSPNRYDQDRGFDAAEEVAAGLPAFTRGGHGAGLVVGEGVKINGCQPQELPLIVSADI